MIQRLNDENQMLQDRITQLHSEGQITKSDSEKRIEELEETVQQLGNLVRGLTEEIEEKGKDY